MSESHFFCIYSGREEPESRRTLEHIVPYSLGGPGEFGTRDVSAKANSDVGTIADAPLVNHPLITIQRWRLQLRAQSGEIPGITFRGTIDFNGSAVETRYDIRPDGSVELKTMPNVQSDWANREFRVRCDPLQLPVILDNIVSKGNKKGVSISLEDIRIKSSEQVRIEHPVLSTNLSVGLFDLCPGFAKMALGTGHLVFGEDWSRGKDAGLLRSVINERDTERRNAIPVHGQVWPKIPDENLIKRNCHIDNDKHVLIVLNQRPVAFYALFFGRFDGSIQLAENPIDGTRLPPGKGIAFVICCKTRKVASFDWEDFIINQMIEKGKIKLESK
jgi:hypothetical protein